MTTVRWEGSQLRALEAELRDATGKVPDAVREAMKAGGERVAKTARGLAPKRTGKLAGSITSTVVSSGTDVVVEVGPTIYYGRFQEHGTSKMAPHPFLGPALEAEGDAVVDRVAEAAIKALS